MKPTMLKTLRTGVLAAALALLAQAAPASLFTYNQNDLLLGFSATGGTGFGTEYVVNLGQVSSFTAGSLVNLNTDLAAQFGANWYNRSDLYWGAFAAAYTGPVGNDPRYTVYVSARPGYSTPATDSVGAQSGTAGQVQAVGSALTTKTTTGNVPNAVDHATADFNSYTSKQNGDRNFTLDAYSDTENTFSGGSSLDLYQVKPDGNQNPGTLMGSLSIDSSGLVTTSVPEPSTWAMLGISAAGLVLMAARRGKAARA